MGIYYFDTSALLKRYVAEAGSTWVRQVSTDQDLQTGLPLHEVMIGEVTRVEVAAAIAKKVAKTHEISTVEGDAAYQLFLSHAEADYGIVLLTSPLIRNAAILARQHALRAYDALQLALAIHANALLKANDLALTFVAADKALLQTAQSEGLATDSPHHHADLDQQPSN